MRLVLCCDDVQVAQIINVVQSVILPFGLIPLIHITASQEIMVSSLISPACMAHHCTLDVF